jgi:group I intron endonuclease
MKISGIYKIQSKIKPERIYIGSSENISKRWVTHKCILKRNIHHSIKLQRHFNKYGEQDLVFSIILECFKEDLIKNEQGFLDLLNPWFNIDKKATNCSGCKRSEKIIQKIRDARKRQTSTNKGKHWILSEESRNNISKGCIGINKGRKHTEKSKENMGKGQIGKTPWNKGLTKELDDRVKKYVLSKPKKYKNKIAA